MELTSIASIQGEGYYSPFADQPVLTRGVVIAHSRRGFFIQDPAGKPNALTSCGLFVLSRKHRPPIGSYCEVGGKVLDYLATEFDRPVTEIKAVKVDVIDAEGAAIDAVVIGAELLEESPEVLAQFLNSHEGMLATILAGARFVAASNPFADYVVAPAGLSERFLRSEHGGVLIDANVPDQWLPSFRVVDYEQASPVDVGATLGADVTGALNYRSQSWQIACNQGASIQPGPDITDTVTSLHSDDSSLAVMTLNTLNLDVKIESKDKVLDPRRDIDDDVGEGRFLRLARAIVKQARSPDVVALQEIQDNDGAEISEVVDASETYKLLINQVLQLGGPRYAWLDIPPEVGADGGQPGGNIRNAYLYDPARVDVLPGSLQRLANQQEAFEASRKPLTATFSLKAHSNAQLTVINVHLASKRHQRGMFAPELPGHDPKLSMRVDQARILRAVLDELDELGRDYFVTGDFNDNEFSAPIRALLGESSGKLVDYMSPAERYDYNHRGKLQVLMHGIVSLRQKNENRIQYEILHGNELLGVTPGDGGGKASDHAYTMAQLSFAEQ
ncbi:MAG: endonuclease/exonuclease/phosphatase family protein [Pseudomonadales bacterium]